jgi:HAE1 family hydrophobic/amphiphilic exporter-1
VMLIVAASFWATWAVATKLDTELLPVVHQGEFTFEVSLPVGTPIEQTQATLTAVEKSILASRGDIEALLVTYGYDVTNVKRSDEGEHSARFKTLVSPSRNPDKTEARVMERMRAEFANLPDTDFRVVRPVLFSSQTPIEVEIHGDNLTTLRSFAQEVRDILSGLPELADVETTLKAGAPEIQVVYDRDQLMRFGLNINTVATQVRNMVQGYEATRFNMQDRRIPILVRLDDSDRSRLEDIERLTVNPGGQKAIPLDAVAELEVGEGPSEIRRIDGQRVALIQANIGEGSLGSAVAAIERTLKERVDWPADMTFFITGQSEEWERSKGSLYLALGLSLFLVYVIMASQFESLIQPFIIMFTIPLAFLGTVIGLKLLGHSLSIVVFLGIIMLAGIVVNNAIVLVDYVNRLRGRGLPLEEAIVEAGKARLRPILMTTATTVLGLLPMAAGLGDGAEIRTPMAISVICGLVTSTLLTLLVVPTVTYLLESAKERFIGEPDETEEEPQTGWSA